MLKRIKLISWLVVHHKFTEANPVCHIENCHSALHAAKEPCFGLLKEKRSHLGGNLLGLAKRDEKEKNIRKFSALNRIRLYNTTKCH